MIRNALLAGIAAALVVAGPQAITPGQVGQERRLSVLIPVDMEGVAVW
jgi:hypothetical protein